LLELIASTRCLNNLAEKMRFAHTSPIGVMWLPIAVSWPGRGLLQAGDASNQGQMFVVGARSQVKKCTRLPRQNSVQRTITMVQQSGLLRGGRFLNYVFDMPGGGRSIG